MARSFSGDVMTVTGDGAAIATLTFAPGYDDANTSVSEDAGVVTVETTSPACFAAGTRIATPRGEVAVEALAVGDEVVTLGGAVRPVRWIGRRRIDLVRHPAPEEARPIRIAAGALARGVPSRDLLVSPDHAMLVDGMLLPARLLLNGRSVTQEDRLSAVTYLHLELDAHDILLADGAPAESYLDTGNRGVFHNARVTDLHPRLSIGRGAASGACLPLETAPQRVQPVWARVAARAGVEAAPDGPSRACDAGLALEVGGRVLRPVTTAGGRVVFVLPPAAGAVRLLSRAGRPSAARPWLDDRRLLGVQVRRILADETALALDGPALGEGWWPPERGVRGPPSRWTDGAAAIAVPAGTAVLAVDVIGAGPSLRADASGASAETFPATAPGRAVGRRSR